MATNLTAEKVKDSFSQLLHIDGGPEATPKTVYSGTGTATALKVGTTNIEVDNIRIDGNTISTTNTNGDLILSPNGSGAVVIDNVEITGGTITGASFPGTFTGITLIESTTLATSDAETGLTLTENTISADGTDTNIDINITPKGTGEVNLPKVDVDGGAIDGTTVGATTPASVKGTTVEATTSIGYPVGTGGTVTQLTSKSTGVTLDKITGQITMDNATLNRNTGVSFTLTNSFIGATDVVVANIASGATPTAYVLGVTVISAGSCSFHLHNLLSGTDLSEAITINFAIIKGAHS
jgi:hypothetical protein